MANHYLSFRYSLYYMINQIMIIWIFRVSNQEIYQIFLIIIFYYYIILIIIRFHWFKYSLNFVSFHL